MEVGRDEEARTFAFAIIHDAANFGPKPSEAGNLVAEAHNLLGVAAIRSGDHTLAIKAFQAAVAASDGKDARYLHNLGMASDRAGLIAQAAQIYANLVHRFPSHATGRRRLVKALLTLGKSAAALSHLHHLQKGKAGDSELLQLAGFALLGLRRYAQALDPLERSLAIRPDNVETLKLIAAALSATKRHDKAAQYLRRALALRDDDNEIRYQLAIVLDTLDESADAMALYKQCLVSSTRADDSTLRMAKLHHRLGQPDECIAILKEVLTRRPRFFAALDALGETFARFRRLDALNALVRDQIALAPGPHVWNALAIHLKTAGEREQAADLWRQAAQRYSSMSVIAYNLGHMLNELSYAEEAETHLRRAIVLDSHYARAWNALAVSLEIQHRYDEAILALNAATMLNPQMASAWLNFGIAQRARNDFAGAIASFRKALAIDRSHAVAHQNLAYTLLFVGEIEQGFREYDWRWLVPDFPSPKRRYRHSVWDGRPLSKAGLVVWMEQGMGDEVMFSWYLPLVQQRVKRLIVDCDPRLIPIFQRSFPGIECVARDISVVDPRTVEPDIKFKAPSGHLPKFFFAETHDAIRRTWDYAGKAYTRAPGYLKADPIRQAYWRRLLQDRFGHKFFIGISWRSAHRTRMRDIQYPGLEQMAELLGHDVVVVNCQYSCQDEEIVQLEQHARNKGFTFFHPPNIDLKDDLDDVFALLSALDLVISPLISLPWMAGAVGTPCWVLRTNETSRIWQQLGAPYVPWVPSLRLFFRHPLESWDVPVKRIHDELGSLVAAELSSRGSARDAQARA